MPLGEEAARPVARRLGLALGSFLLVGKLPGSPPLLLTAAERSISVRGAYATCEGMRVDNLRVLLVDDVMTASSGTRDGCARFEKGGSGRSSGVDRGPARPRLAAA
jgi:hypothetical protein